MKHSTQHIKTRQSLLLEQLSNVHTDSVHHLAQLLSVSEMTIRRDLDTLQKMGLIERQYGQARIIPKTQTEHTNGHSLLHIKTQLAKIAASFIQPRSTIFINSSSTAVHIMEYLTQEQVTILTNNLHASSFAIPTEHTLLLTGGEVRFPKEALVGNATIESLHHVYADASFIGCTGISEEGIFTNNVYEAQVNQTMITHTKGTCIAIADYRKVGQTSNFKSTHSLDCIDYLITDTYANSDELKQIEAQGVQIIQTTI